jgi:hypothetical protein
MASPGREGEIKMRYAAHNSTLKAALDGGNPQSLVAMVEGDALEKAVKRVPKALWELGEAELREQAKPTRTEYALRMALWNEFRLASRNGTRIIASRIYTGICSYQNWFTNILGNPAKVAWLLCPLQDFEQSLEPLLARIAERYDEILNMDIYDAKGKPDPALVKLVLKAAEQVEGRLRGAPVQKSENKNLNLTMSNPRLPHTERPSPQELEDRLRQLEEREEQQRLGFGPGRVE